MAKSRVITAIQTERPVYKDLNVFTVGDKVDGDKTVEGIDRAIGGLDKISSAGPATLGPNCPSFIVTLSFNKYVKLYRRD